VIQQWRDGIVAGRLPGASEGVASLALADVGQAILEITQGIAKTDFGQ
jgi:hypothetical protein